MREVTITVSGEAKVGKTTLIALIAKALHAAGIHVENSVPTAQDDINEIIRLCHDEEKLAASLVVFKGKAKVILKQEQLMKEKE